MPSDSRGYLPAVTQVITDLRARERSRERVAVVVNGNARKVTEDLVRQLEGVVQPGDLFVSRTLEEAEPIARSIVERGYPTVLTGGGDGTFVLMVTSDRAGST